MLSFHPSINSKILTGFKGISWGCGMRRVELREPVQTVVVLQIEVCGGRGRNLPQDVNVLILETYVFLPSLVALGVGLGYLFDFFLIS